MPLSRPTPRQLARPLSSPLAGGGGAVPVFESFWDTTKLSTGSSNATSIKIPTVSDGTYNCVVDWGDGTFSTITTWDDAAWTHDYGSGNGGLKTVRMTGTFIGFHCRLVPDSVKLLSISTWGKAGNGVTDRFGNFNGAANLTSVGDLDFSGLTTMRQMFQNASSFTQDLSDKNVGLCTDMNSAFANTRINFNMGPWNISNVTDMVGLMSFTLMSVNNMDLTLNGWASRPVQPNVNCSFHNAKYSILGKPGYDILTGAPNNWTILSGGMV